jgi:hypothetical protein
LWYLSHFIQKPWYINLSPIKDSFVAEAAVLHFKKLLNKGIIL